MPKEVKFYKKKKWMVLAIALIIISVSVYGYLNKTVAPVYDFIIAKKSNVMQEVSVTGRVKAAESVDLAFQTGGKTEKIYAEVGDKVKTGDLLISLNSDDLKAQLRQAQANVSSAAARQKQYEAAVNAEQAKLDDLKNGYSREEIRLAETSVSNAKKVITDSETKLSDTKLKADADMDSVYADALNSLPGAVYSGKSALITMTDIQYAHFSSMDPDNNIIASAKEAAVYELFGVSNAGRWITKSINDLNSGLYGQAQSAPSGADTVNTDDLLKKTINALRKVKSALDSIPLSETLTSTEKTSLDSQKSNINSEIAALSAKQQNISVQKANNNSAISSAQATLNSAKNGLETAQNELKLKKAGSSADQISAQKAQVDSAKANLASQKASVSEALANVQYYVAQIDKTVLKTPIDGIVTRMDAKPGEIVTPGNSTSDLQKPLVSIISEGTFEIEADIPEVDIAEVAVGNTAKITLDAYGSDVEFGAVVLAIDPAETMVEGVATYKTTLAFTSEDARIKPGMTANIDILTAEKDNVIAIPQRAVIAKDGSKVVRILKTIADINNPRKTIEQLDTVTVETGLRDTSGAVEIISGVNEGDKVVVYIKETK
jgi:HlyD family secretion protein